VSLFDMTGQVAVVTGSTRGIGLSTAQQMAVQGAKVIVSSRNQADCDQVAADLNRRHGKGAIVAKALAYDITRIDRAEAFAAACEAAFGKVDTLVGNAAIIPGYEFDEILVGNIHANHALCEAFRPLIRRQGGGAIILIGSIAGHYPMFDIMPYAAAKAGVAHLARCLAEEMLTDNIRVNCIARGMIRVSVARDRGDADFRRRGLGVPLGRGGEPDEVAGACVFLAAKAGGYVTGTTIHVDGGRAFLRSHPVPEI
jgi:NAD(P)-dependent dehydrogenase (short-subunit alcohol dehydrogenase family)